MARLENPIPRVLDLETGQIEYLALSKGDRISHASCSPWRDALGRPHAIASWKRMEGTGLEKVIREYGLARLTLPDGEIYDRIVLDVLPRSEPVWLPGSRTRILFAGLHGALYRLTLSDVDGPGAEQEADDFERPKPLDWLFPPARLSQLVISDPSSCDEAGLRDTLVVSLIRAGEPGGSSGLFAPGLWWLKLSPDGRSIVDSGHLRVPRCETDSKETNERYPRVAKAPDGRLVLAYLVRHKDRNEYQMRLASLRVDPATGRPWVDPKSVVAVGDDCLLTPPSFSADGRWLHVVPHGEQASMRSRRLSVLEAMNDGPDLDAPSSFPRLLSRADLTDMGHRRVLTVNRR